MYFDIEAHRDCFKTSEDGAYFWHGRSNGVGGQFNAQEIALENNGKTLEMCMFENRNRLEQVGVEFEERKNGKIIITYNGNEDEKTQFWDDCSKVFAEQASGNVHVIEGIDPRPNGQSERDFPSVYNRIEHPALEQNENVCSITHIDPYTKQQTEIESFNRSQGCSSEVAGTPPDKEVPLDMATVTEAPSNPSINNSLSSTANKLSSTGIS